MKTVVTFLLVALTMIACCGATTSLAAPGQESLTQSNRLAQLRANEGKIILEAPLLTSQLIYESASIGLRHDRYGEPVMIMGDGSRKSMAGSCFQPIRSRICVSTNALDHFSGGRLVRESTRSLSPNNPDGLPPYGEPARARQLLTHLSRHEVRVPVRFAAGEA
jgi:hypothetical protein